MVGLTAARPSLSLWFSTWSLSLAPSLTELPLAISLLVFTVEAVFYGLCSNVDTAGVCWCVGC